MMKSNRIARHFLPVIIFLSACVGTVPGAAGEPSKSSAVRIVNCDQKVQSGKRGLCANYLSAEDFRSIGPGVSWWYNWHFETSNSSPSGVSVAFLPMVWGQGPERLTGLERYLAAGHKPRAILAINEPNLRGQAFLSPEETANLYRQIKAIADKAGVPVIGPHMALGSAVPDSITAVDPFEKKPVTYGTMVPFLKAFRFYTGDTEVPATALHTYGSVGELHWAVDLLHKEFNRPVWVTEYAQWGAANSAAARTYLIQATDFLERSPDVAGYAWFKERVENNRKISLFEDQPGKLTPLGEAYVAMPVHDADLYYRIPGRLPAGNYVALKQMEIWPTTDPDGFVHMTATEAGAWLDYHVHVDVAGIYGLRFHAAGPPGEISVLQGDRVLVSVKSSQPDWQTIAAPVPLPMGSQTIRIRCGSKDQSINWIEFTKP